MNRALTLITTTILILLIAMTSRTLATNYYTSPVPNENSGLGFSFLKPSFPYEDRFGFATGSFLFNGHLNISPESALNIIIPFSNIGGVSYSDNAKQGIGNIFVQYRLIQNRSETDKSWLSFEVFLPTSDRNNIAWDISYLSDYHRHQMYYPEVWSFGGTYAKFEKFGPDNSAYLQYEFGPRLTLTSDTNNEADFVFHYAFAFGLDNSEYSLGAEFLGQFLVTGDDMNFYERSSNQIVFGISNVKNNFQPKLYYQIPLDDGFNDLIGSVLGLGFDVIID